MVVGGLHLGCEDGGWWRWWRGAGGMQNMGERVSGDIIVLCPDFQLIFYYKHTYLHLYLGSITILCLYPWSHLGETTLKPN